MLYLQSYLYQVFLILVFKNFSFFINVIHPLLLFLLTIIIISHMGVIAIFFWFMINIYYLLILFINLLMLICNFSSPPLIFIFNLIFYQTFILFLFKDYLQDLQNSLQYNQNRLFFQTYNYFILEIYFILYILFKKKTIINFFIF